jgi:hypothetical protein
MREHKTLHNVFQWIPYPERESRFGGCVPYKEGEEGSPLFWITCYPSGQDAITDIFLVNSSEEFLSLVSSSTGAMVTVDDEAHSSASEGYNYKNVSPRDAVKIDQYNVIYDSDYLLQFSVHIQSEKYGHLDFRTLPTKGKCPGEMALLWAPGKPGRDVSHFEEV